MDEFACDQLAELLKEQGRAVCCMPRTFGQLLRERCPQAEQQVRELTLALENGTVGQLQAPDGPPGHDEMARRLADKTDLAEDRALWAVRAWAFALDGPVARSSADSPRAWGDWNALAADGGTTSSITKRLMVCLALVAAAGLVGGALPGLHYLIGGEVAPGRAGHDVRAQLQHDPLRLCYPLFGAIGAMVGGILAWIVGHSMWNNSEPHRIPVVRLGLNVIGVFFGGLLGASMGPLVGGSPGAMLFAGLFSGLFGFADGFARRWWWRSSSYYDGSYDDTSADYGDSSGGDTGDYS